MHHLYYVSTWITYHYINASLADHTGEKYTLRYTGGMVPDVFQILVKEKGVFTNVTSPTTKAKLRILFEVAPLALLVSTQSTLTADVRGLLLCWSHKSVWGLL